LGKSKTFHTHQHAKSDLSLDNLDPNHTNSRDHNKNHHHNSLNSVANNTKKNQNNKKNNNKNKNKNGNKKNDNNDNNNKNNHLAIDPKTQKKRHSTSDITQQLHASAAAIPKKINTRPAKKKNGVPTIIPSKNSLIVGDSESQAIFIDETLNHGISTPCKVFESPILVTNERGEFQIKYVELWSVE